MAYKYYATQRPLGPGTIPRNSKIVHIENFGIKSYQSEIDRDAWGYLETERPLSDEDVFDYELAPAQ